MKITIMSQQELKVSQKQNQLLSGMELRQHGSAAGVSNNKMNPQQSSITSLGNRNNHKMMVNNNRPNNIPYVFPQTINMPNFQKNPTHTQKQCSEPQQQKLRSTSQQAIATEQAVNPMNRGKQSSHSLFLPAIVPLIDKDKATQLRASYNRLADQPSGKECQGKGSPSTKIVEDVPPISSLNAKKKDVPNEPPSVIGKRIRDQESKTATCSQITKDLKPPPSEDEEQKNKKAKASENKSATSQVQFDSLAILKYIAEHKAIESKTSQENPPTVSQSNDPKSTRDKFFPLPISKGAPAVTPSPTTPPPNAFSSSCSSIPSTAISGKFLSELSIVDRVKVLLQRYAQSTTSSSSASVQPIGEEISKARQFLASIKKEKPSVVLGKHADIIEAILVLQRDPGITTAHQTRLSKLHSKLPTLNEIYSTYNQKIIEVHTFLKQNLEMESAMEAKSKAYKELSEVEKDVESEANNLQSKVASLEKELEDVKTSLLMVMAKKKDIDENKSLLRVQMEKGAKLLEGRRNQTKQKEEEQTRAAAFALKVEAVVPLALSLLDCIHD